MSFTKHSAAALECGGKGRRPATPFSSVLRNHKNLKAASPLRSAAALQIVALIFGGITSVHAAAESQTQSASSAKSVLAVSVVTPEQCEWDVSVPASGWFAPWQEAVVASEIDGLRITKILADVGDVVKQGQPLAMLSQDAVRADLRRLEAAVDSAEALHAVARADANRALRLRPSGAQTEQEYDERINAEKTAAAALAMARADLDNQRIRLQQTTIVAPDDGVVSARTATLGSVAGIGSELFRIIRRQRIEWQAEVGAQHARDIRPGQAAVIKLSDGARITGTVRALAPAAARDTARTLVYVDVPASANARAGVYASGNIIRETTPALTVPETALVLRDGLHYLYTLPPENDRTVTRIRVETGRRRDGRVEIIRGLAPGARVVRSGGAFLSDGATVTLVANAN
ncbi:efflux RND transporter periplasmic adaptor subunit [Ereboglobus luteus]|uniref:Uncharacterized protein n=1 Tax=Ereboglobus luteus TaxID=1796921 RepID=A0A2U8E4X7_9BACT|nr:efflux RND transporter periplasmic adaptor subunit [Ereboglobus luteus]AWI09917.1 hypothetical protein CKA38_12240 [Ereboglobus luteus]